MAAQLLQGTQAALAALSPASSGGAQASGSSAVDLITQSQQGFASLETASKAAAEKNQETGKTAVATTGMDANSGAAGADRVTALYLANGSAGASAASPA